MSPSPSSPRRSGAVQLQLASLIQTVLSLFVSTRPPARLPALSDDILQDIFLRIDSFADLACASSTCANFRRIISDHSFLRRYRSLHPPLLLGFVAAGRQGFQPAGASHPNAAAADGFDNDVGHRFYSYFVPGGRWSRQWVPCDVRDGRVLLKSVPNPKLFGLYNGVVWADLAVFDPVFGRDILLPSITEDLLASVEIEDHDIQCFQPVLVPYYGEDEDETSFKVIGRAYCGTKTVVFVFSRCSGSWIVGASIRWDALGLDMPAYYDQTCHYAYGCFFWRLRIVNKLLKLDMNRMEFSTIDLPLDLLPEYRPYQCIVLAEAGEGRLVMFSQLYGGQPMYYYTTQHNRSEGPNVWQKKGTVPLPSPYICSLKCAAQGYIFLVGFTEDQGMSYPVCFSLEVKTFKIERIGDIIRFKRWYNIDIYPYFGFPVSMSPRRL
ncbi:hypothetical protein PR202_gb21180 [Eleusine coracana subsp. coracana]|uniref:F-box domain-containing protein n=1 Tax=Eleusine coracana subsp. coracana TaxID=191504 RepID=A0AAV5FCL7_ELECO|nr:hypothetical protein QOZ80_7BG0603170 [Eleusine coracana subsp. coracana]GJN32660.1 hypothetical protein PR202_gb21180 [Eleusine coracana subsp. coracana]